MWKYCDNEMLHADRTWPFKVSTSQSKSTLQHQKFHTWLCNSGLQMIKLSINTVPCTFMPKEETKC